MSKERVYTVRFHITDTEKFKEFHRLVVTNMMGDGEAIAGAKATACGWDDPYTEVNECNDYIEYLFSFNQKARTFDLPLDFDEWKKIGMPTEYKEEDHD